MLYFQNTSRETTQFYKEAQTAARVVSRTCAMLLDKEVLPFNMTNFISVVDNIVQLTIDYFDRKIPGRLLVSRKGRIAMGKNF